MCVAIAMEPNTELSLDEVFKMGRSNADGIGVAWAEDGQVHWYKSINYTPQSAQKFIADRAGFFRLVHFRLSTVGGVRVDLCHPFEVGPLANPGQQGHSARVLIHNGHWYRWKDILDLLEKEDALPDKGPWSDSRLAAYLASRDPGWLEVVTGKIATLSGTGDISLVGNWETLRPGIKVSNKTWDHGFNYKRSGKDRDWPGWGQTAEYWEERDKHMAHLAEEAAKKEEAEKKKNEQEKAPEKAGETGGNGRYEPKPKFKPYTHQPAESRVAGAPGNSGVLQTGNGAWGNRGGLSLVGGAGDAGAHGVGGVARSFVRVGPGEGEQGKRTLYVYKDGKESIETEGEFHANGQARVKVGEKEIAYDHTPWFNETLNKWYWIPPESVNGARYKIETIDERHARAILESITTPLHGADRK